MNTVKLMVKGGVLFVTLQEFNSAKADMSPDKITSADMGQGGLAVVNVGDDGEISDLG